MNQIPKKMPQNGIQHTLYGDCFLPDLTLADTHRQTICRYGRMRKKYLEEYRPGLYEQLLLSGCLYDHISEIDQICRDRLEVIIRRMAEAEGVDEALKARDQLAWVARMNNIRQRAEEMILTELVFA